MQSESVAVPGSERAAVAGFGAVLDALVSAGIRSAARYAGAPQKYNLTVSRAWVELAGHHAADSRAADFGPFADQNPALLDKRLLTRFYRTQTLAGAAARTSWVEPDQHPFPWQNPGQ